MDWQHLEWIERCATDAAADLAAIHGNLTDGVAIAKVAHARACLEEIVSALKPKVVVIHPPAPESVVDCPAR